MKLVRFVLGFVAIFAASNGISNAADVVAPAVTIDGRFGTHCPVGHTVRGEVEICRVSLYRLIAMPASFHGKVVAVEGYLTSYLNNVVLFADRESSQGGISMNGIEVNTDRNTDPEILKTLTEGIWPALVVGRFDAHCTGGMVQFSGCITDTFAIANRGKAVKR